MSESLDSMLVNDKGRWVISNHLRLDTSNGFVWQSAYRCSDPSSVVHYRAQDHSENHAVVLTEAESMIRVGDLSWDKLNSWVLSLWGFLHLNLKVTVPPEDGSVGVGYEEWLSYFIAQDHCFGVVHALVAALVRKGYRRQCKLKLVEQLSQYSQATTGLNRSIYTLFSTSCECIDGVLTNERRAPLLEWQGYKMLDIKDHRTGVRRVWDICANKVIPWVDSSTFHIVPISHAWVAQEDIEYVVTSVNHYLWPVPLPRGVQLEDIRKELIQQSVRYAWLDVLCLRQTSCPNLSSESLKRLHSEMQRHCKGKLCCCQEQNYFNLVKRREGRRMKEWEVDIPLIGYVYSSRSPVMVYLSGLGRPFNTNQDWGDSRNWLQRAWTLQETKPRSGTIICGLSEGMDPWLCKIDKIGTTLHTAMQNIAPNPHQPDFPRLFSEMRRRSASTSLDRIWGLFFPCHYLSIFGEASPFDAPKALPLYIQDEEPEHAWQRFVHAAAQIGEPRLSPRVKRRPWPHIIADTLALYLLLHFPHPSKEHWFPSLRQVQAYPDVSLQEPQLEDNVSPSMEAPLSIKCGRLYRGVTLVRASSPDCILASTPGCISPIKLNSIDHAAAYLELVPGQTYTLIDLTPFYSRKVDAEVTPDSLDSPDYGHNRRLGKFEPLCEWNLIIVCRELSEWNPQAPPGDGPYQYRLRRVTSLFWKRDPFNNIARWLPFEETLETKLPSKAESFGMWWEKSQRHWHIPNPQGGDEILYVEALLQ